MGNETERWIRGGRGDSPSAGWQAFAARGAAVTSSSLVSQLLDQAAPSLDASAREELLSLFPERDSAFFSEALYSWAQRQETQGRHEAAGLAYRAIAQGDFSAAIRERAQGRLAALQGAGSSALRAEVLLRRLGREASDPVMLLGMAAGSTVFSAARAGIMSRLLSSPGTGFITRGLGARAVAATGAFALEVPAFWATTKGLNEALHPGLQRWDLDTNLCELAGLGLTLGALKLTGALAGGLSRNPLLRNPGAPPSPVPGRFEGLFGQAGMFGGILLGHRLEEAAGLRAPVDGATTFTDSLAMLIQFNVGGRLMQGAFPGLHRLGHELTLRSQALEAASTRETRPSFLDFSGGLLPLEATAGGRLPAPRGGDGLETARGLAMMMTGPKDGFDGGRPARLTSLDRAPDEGPPPKLLPERTGSARDSSGKVTDPFEPKIMPPNRILKLSLERAQQEGADPQQEIMDHTPFAKGDYDKVNPEHLGRGLGLALQARMREIDGLLADPSADQVFETLGPSFRRALISADEMVGMVEYFTRANQVNVLNSFRAAIERETWDRYDNLKQVLIHYLGPHVSRTIEPNEGILSIGSGDMMALLALFRHRIAPGQLSWRTRLMVHARQQNVADEINVEGTYRDKLKGVQINFRHDPQIVAVGPAGLRGVTHSDLHRAFRLQVLNVPSDKLHEVLTEDYIRSLPNRALLFEVIGGFIGRENRGIFQPAPGDRETVLPFQLINQALRHFGREDVTVISGGGFIPGKHLWRGEPVEMLFAGPDSDAHPNVAPEAKLLAVTFAGEGFDNGFLRAGHTHNQRSTELGKALKNVTSLLAGFNTAALVARMIDGAVVSANPRGDFETLVRDPLFRMMEGILLVNEQLDPLKAKYNQEVRNDFWQCTDINIVEVRRVLEAARALPVNDRKTLENFLTREIVDNPIIATTRNPKRGIAEYIIQHWRERGSAYRTEELLPRGDDGKPKMTQEGVNSIGPLMAYYNFPLQDIESRGLDEMFYQGHRLFLGTEPVRPPTLGEGLREALRGEFAGIPEEAVRRALEGRSMHSVELLDFEIRRLRKYRHTVKGEQSFDIIRRQEEAVRHLLDIMRNNDVVRVMRVHNALLCQPYGNMFRVRMKEPGTRIDTNFAFIRVDAGGIRERMTQLGMFLRSFREGTRLTTHIELEGLDSRKDFALRAELEFMTRSILTAFHDSRRSDNVQVILNNTVLRPDAMERQPLSEDYFRSLAPLVERLNRSNTDRSVTAPMLRNAGPDQAKLLDNLLQHSPAWPMLLGYFGGPINRAIKSALTRPERGTFVGIYSGGQLVDSFMVYRNGRNEAMALSHHLTSQLEADPSLASHNGDPQSIDYFEGMELNRFLQNYEDFANRTGLGRVDYRMLDIKSLPLETALVDEIPGVNAALLRIFLEGKDDVPWVAARQAMLNELTPLYEEPLPEIQSRLVTILNRYLNPFYERYGELLGIDNIGIFRYVRDHGPGSLRRSTRDGADPD